MKIMLPLHLRTVFAASAVLLFFSAALNTNAATFTVNNNGDATDITAGNGTCETATGNGICTLRSAVVEANALGGNDIINFDAGISLITLTSGSQILISSNVTINGNGANLLTIDGGAGINRIFFVNSATVTIQGVTLSGGNADFSNDGAAVIALTGTLVLESVVVQNNTGGGGTGAVSLVLGVNHRISNSTISQNTGFRACAALRAGLPSGGTSLTIVNTTVSGNSTNDLGQGAICIGGGSATFRNTTISGNTAVGGSDGGGGIVNSGSVINLGNTIVADNTAPNGPDLYRFDSKATFTTSGGNLIGDNSGNPSAPNTTTFPTGNPNVNGDKVGDAANPINPLLGPLANNGGTTPTRALLIGSPAIDAGVNANAVGLLRDQRGEGFPRIQDGNADGTLTVDIGAFEFQAAPTAASVSISGRVTTPDGRGIRNVRITLLDASGNARTALTSSFGYYSFEDVESGDTYVVTANAKRITFNQPSQVLSLVDNAVDINFIGW